MNAPVRTPKNRSIEDRLHAAETSFRHMAENVPGALFRYHLRTDGTDVIEYMSAGCLDLWEVDFQSIQNDATILWQMVDEEDRSPMQASVRTSAADLAPWTFEWRITTPSGKRKWLRGVGRPYREPDGTVVWNSFILDVSEARLTLDALTASEKRLSQIMAITGEGIWDWNLLGGTVAHNLRWCQLVGLDGEHLEHDLKVFWEHVHPDDKEDVLSRVDACLFGRIPYSSEHRLLRSDGTVCWVEDRGDVAERGPDGTPLRMLGSISDITTRKNAEAESARLAYFDALTGLPNRRMLLDRLSQAIAGARQTGTGGAVIFADLDEFKNVNDTRGHAVGDGLLRVAAERLSMLMRASDTLARLGGDEFVIIAGGLELESEQAGKAAMALAETIRAAFEQPLEVNGESYQVTTSLGITLLSGNPGGPDDLLREADTAMYRAKAAGRNQAAFFEESMQRDLEVRMRLEADLRRALCGNEFAIHLQSQVDHRGECVGAEVLIRWNHPRDGLVPPAGFIPVAESSGLIVAIGDWVLEEACRTLGVLDRAGRSIPLSLNVSPRQFRQADFVDRVRKVLDRHGTDPRRLVFEITEGLLMEEHLGSTVQKMRELAELGIRFSIDDFGTGYSSLAYLKTLPIDEIKIDQRFVRGIPDDADDVAIVETILAMADHLRLLVVAEGVETAQQAARLVENGCTRLQGYLFGKPMPVSEWLSTDVG